MSSAEDSDGTILRAAACVLRDHGYGASASGAIELADKLEPQPVLNGLYWCHLAGRAGRGPTEEQWQLLRRVADGWCRDLTKIRDLDEHEVDQWRMADAQYDGATGALVMSMELGL